MKKLLYIMASSLFLLWGCEPMEDVYNDLDEEQGAYSEDIEITLEDADYSSLSEIAEKMGNNDAAEFIDEYMSFSEEYMAADYIPGFLSEEYIALKESSSAKVTFNYTQPIPDYVDNYMINYELSSSDYVSVDASLGFIDAFSPSFPAEGNASTIMDSQFPDKPNGSLAYVSYRVSDVDVEAPPELFFEEHFDGDFGDFETVSLDGEQSWELDDYNDDEYAKISGFSGGANTNNDWLVSSVIDLSGQTSAYMTIRQAANYLDDWANLKVMVSSDYAGDIEAASWTEITVEEKPEGDSWGFVESEAVNLSDWAGENITIAFNYNSTTSEAATWEIDWIKVSKTPIPQYSYYSDVFEYQDGWQKFDVEAGDTFEDGVYLIQAEDYDAMGDPGDYNNFSSSDNPDNYIPQLISLNLPFAQEGESVVVAYMYYAGSTKLKASEYIYNGTTWLNTSRIIERTEQFVHNGTKWVFDPTVVFTMTTDDYQMVVDYVSRDLESSYVNSYGTAEYYFGADAYFENFDLRISNRTENDIPGFAGLSTEEAVDLSYERLTEAVEVLLQEKYPDAVTQVNGVDVHYIVTVDTYENDLSRGKYTFDFQCISDGPDPEFELIEGPEF
ncbi:choice-of-anchor J domain-containing protein [Marinilabilia rubra]|uniref:DUF5017 domain-containing protein n=1 Tax=Marinilabilia rubra TaxID=2162893 RepID=A0A2U2B5P1_9BACT|nr:choice-of-anchor J domain-containing protein [Marinilabilia rubra]PWD98353.1 DUF5017 domain-containing protein [Marinilabilia rubra]